MAHKVLFAVIAGLALSACSKPPEKEKEPPPVQVTSVTQATIRRIVQGDGALFPIDQAAIMPKIAAPVEKFYVNRGAAVKRGQLLAVLESRDLVSAVAESQGAVEVAESNLRTTEVSTVPDTVVKAQADMQAAREVRESARRVLDNRQQLFKQGALAGRVVDEAQVAFAQAENNARAAEAHFKALEAVRQDQIRAAAAQLRSARAHQGAQEAQVAYAHILSPLTGVVADRPLNAGEMANPGVPIVTVVDISRVVARVNVPQAEAVLVHVGQSARLTQPDGAEEIEGKVTVVSPAADANTTTVQIWIEVPNPDGRLKPGAAVHAAIAAEEIKAATVVPVSAILPGEDGGSAVLTVSADSVVHRRTVTLGVREGNRVQILSGATSGEEVVTVGGMGLDDKAKVRIVTPVVEEAGAEDDNAPGEPSQDTQKGAAKKAPAQPK